MIRIKYPDLISGAVIKMCFRYVVQGRRRGLPFILYQTSDLGYSAQSDLPFRLDTGFKLHLQKWSTLAPSRVRGTPNEQQSYVIRAATQGDFNARAGILINPFCDFAFTKKLIFSLLSIGSR
jgi:hypothetical protein